MRQWFTLLVVCGGLGMGSAIAATPSEPSIPTPQEATPMAQGSFDRLSQMFSPEIQTTVAACWDAGKVDFFAVSPATIPWVICGDGSFVQGVTYMDYLATVSELMAASTLIGMQSAIANDPRLTPEIMAMFVVSEQGTQLLENVVQTAIVQSGLQPADQPSESGPLSQEVVSLLIENLSDPDRLSNLLGTPDQQPQVVAQFCTAPGMSIDAAKQQFPTLDSVQLFAICIHESGAVDELLPGS